MGADMIEDLFFVRSEGKVYPVARIVESNVYEFDGGRARNYILFGQPANTAEEAAQGIINDYYRMLKEYSKDVPLEEKLKNFTWYSGLYFNSFGNSGMKDFDYFKRYVKFRAKYPVEMKDLIEAFSLPYDGGSLEDEENRRHFFSALHSRIYGTGRLMKFFPEIRKRIYGENGKRNKNTKTWGIRVYMNGEPTRKAVFKVTPKKVLFASWPYYAYSAKRTAERAAKRLNALFEGKGYSFKVEQA